MFRPVAFWIAARHNEILDGQAISLVSSCAEFAALRAYHEPAIGPSFRDVAAAFHRAGLVVAFYCTPLRRLTGDRIESAFWTDDIPDEYEISGLVPQNVWPDISNSRYRSFAVERISDILDDIGADGVHMDLFTRTPTGGHPNDLADFCDAHADYKALYVAGVDSFIDALKASTGVATFNGLWSWSITDQKTMLSDLDGGVVEYFGRNPNEPSSAFGDDVRPYIDGISSVALSKEIYVFGRGPREYTDYGDDYDWQRYVYACYLLVKNLNTRFKFHSTFQTPVGNWASDGRSGGLDVYEDWLHDIGSPLETYQESGGIIVRRFDRGFVVVAPDDGVGGSYTVGGAYDLDGNHVSGNQVLAAGESLILHYFPPGAHVDVDLPIISSASPYLDWENAALDSRGTYLELTTPTFIGEHDAMLDWIRDPSPPTTFAARVRLGTGARVLVVAEIDDPGVTEMYAVVQVSALVGVTNPDDAVLYRDEDATIQWPWILGSTISDGAWHDVSLVGATVFAASGYTFRRWVYVRFEGDVDVSSVTVS